VRETNTTLIGSWNECAQLNA